jgi:hypothetical protein
MGGANTCFWGSFLGSASQAGGGRLLWMSLLWPEGSQPGPACSPAQLGILEMLYHSK